MIVIVGFVKIFSARYLASTAAASWAGAEPRGLHLIDIRQIDHAVRIDRVSVVDLRLFLIGTPPILISIGSPTRKTATGQSELRGAEEKKASRISIRPGRKSRCLPRVRGFLAAAASCVLFARLIVAVVVRVVVVILVVLEIDIVQDDAKNVPPTPTIACFTRVSMARGKRRC